MVEYQYLFFAEFCLTNFNFAPMVLSKFLHGIQPNVLLTPFLTVDVRVLAYMNLHMYVYT